jgi:hypothetical protein
MSNYNDAYYEKKYLKYKEKYLRLKQTAGSLDLPELKQIIKDIPTDTYLDRYKNEGIYYILLKKDQIQKIINVVINYNRIDKQNKILKNNFEEDTKNYNQYIKNIKDEELRHKNALKNDKYDTKIVIPIVEKPRLKLTPYKINVKDLLYSVNKAWFIHPNEKDNELKFILINNNSNERKEKVKETLFSYNIESNIKNLQKTIATSGIAPKAFSDADKPIVDNFKKNDELYKSELLLEFKKVKDNRNTYNKVDKANFASLLQMLNDETKDTFTDAIVIKFDKNNIEMASTFDEPSASTTAEE